MDTMTRIAALAADCMKSLWPEAEGLPAAEELLKKYDYHGKYPPDIAAAKTIADISSAIHSRSYAAMTPEEKKNLIISLITDAIS